MPACVYEGIHTEWKKNNKDMTDSVYMLKRFIVVMREKIA